MLGFSLVAACTPVGTPVTTTAAPAPTTTAAPTTTTAAPTTTTPTVSPASIGDRVWIDSDGDGIQDSSESGFAGIVVNAYLVDGPARRLYSSKTTVNGWFRFNAHAGDCISLEVMVPTGYTVSPPNKGTASTNSDADSNGVTPVSCLAPGDSSITDIGLIPSNPNTTTTAPSPSTTAPSTTVTTAPTSTTVPTSDYPNGWNLFWADEFNGSSLDLSKWTINYDTYIAPNQELECYKKENVALGSGNLVITAKKEPTPCGSAGFQDYSSGMIRTSGKFSTAYGRFEMRAKFPKGKGMWPAFWTTSQNQPYGGNGRSGELDIVEVVGSRPNYVVGTAHWAYNGCGWGCSRYGYEYLMPSGDTADGFHTYALEWEPGRLAWYFDGVKYYELGDNGSYKWGSEATQLYKTTDYSTNPLAAYPAPFDATNPQQMILNLAVGGSWAGTPDASTQFPGQMLVDYVRVFKR